MYLSSAACRVKAAPEQDCVAKGDEAAAHVRDGASERGPGTSHLFLGEAENLTHLKFILSISLGLSTQLIMYGSMRDRQNEF